MSSTPMARLDRIELVVVVPCIIPTQVIFAAFLLPACEGARRDPPVFVDEFDACFPEHGLNFF